MSLNKSYNYSIGTMGNINLSGVTTGTINATGLSTLTNATATNVSTGVLIASTGLTTGTINATTIVGSTSISSGLLSATNIVGTNISVGTLSGTTITGANLSLSGNLTVAGTLTTVNITSTNVLNTNVSAGTLAATNSTITNSVSTNVSSGVLIASTGLTTGTINATTIVNTNYTPICEFSNNSTVGNTAVASFLTPNMPTNSVTSSIYVGKSLSTGNSTEIGYTYVGSNNTANSVSISHYGLSAGVYLLNNGVVGIGTGSPGTGFNASIPNAKLTLLSGVSGTENLMTRISLGSGSGHYSAIEGGHLTNGQTSLAFMTCLNAGTNNGNPLTRMYITREGNVGINTTTPSYTLDVSGTSRIGGNHAFIYNNYSSPSTYPNANCVIVEGNSAAGWASFNINSGHDSTTDRYLMTATRSGNTYMSIRMDGNVGIGTGSPSEKFSISGTATKMSLVGSGEGDVVSLYLGTPYLNNRTSGLKNAIISQGIGWSRAHMHFCLETTAQNGSQYDAAISNSRMMISGLTGNVGINTTSPSYTLDVNGTLRTASADINHSATTNGGGAVTISPQTNGTESSITFYQNTGKGGANWVVGHNLAGIGSNSFGIYSSTQGKNMFYIDSSGNVFIKQGGSNPGWRFSNDADPYTYCGPTVANGATGDARLNIQDRAGSCISFYVGATKAGSITASGVSTAYNTSSDYRMKENIIDLTGASSRVKEFKVRRFNFIGHPEKTVDGFVAHEAAEVVPEAVNGEKDAVDDEGNPIMQGIDQSKLVPLLTAALKESILKIEQLEAFIQSKFPGEYTA